MNDLILEKYQSKLSVVAWIHFDNNKTSTSINLHTQNVWSKQYPEILEIIIQDNGDLNIYGLTTEGVSKLSQCKKPMDQIHYECQRNSYRESKLDSVKFRESSLEVVQDIFEVLLEDPMKQNSNQSKAKQYIMPNIVIEKFLERAQTIRRKTLAFLAGYKDGNIITVTHLIIPTEEKFKPPIWGFHSGKYFIN